MSEELIGAAALTSRYLVAFLLLSAAIPKLADRTEFERAVRNYRLLPERIVSVFASWVPGIELTLAIALLVGLGVRFVAAVAALLLTAFALAVAANLARGREIDCGCQGSVAARRIGWGLVAGDVLLVGMALLAALRDPGTLAAYPLSASDAGPSSSESIALLVLAAALVLGWQIGGAALQLWRSAGPLVGTSR
jgi:uncharacterized membrane protein YphA (DoxX/SURF4 family)